MIFEQNRYTISKYNVIHKLELIVCGVLIDILFNFLPIPSPNNTNQTGLVSLVNTKTGVIILLTLLIFAPIIEEFLFRFMIIGPNNTVNVSSKFVYAVRIVFSIMFFGLMHMWGEKFEVNLQYFWMILPYFFGGFLYSYLYVHSNDIKVSIIVHVIYNLIGVITII